ncbi:DNA-directed RNA polymerase [Sphingomonas paeninsulae]|nr:DNA-directed RNA polymerase [Sphingomonas paeninsulae]
MEYVLEAVNSMQSVPWAINQPILDMVEYCFENNIPVDGLPSNQRIILPPKVEPEVWSAMTPAQQKGVKINLASLRTKDRGNVADRMVLLRDLSTAKELSQYDRFYLPHNLDFRGRSYPIPHFSHQRADHIKAQFQFSDGQPFGPLGAAWLSVHLANTGDFQTAKGKGSKLSFDDRQQWVEDNEPAILSVAADPKSDLWWTEADKPFSFLAAAIDYAAWVSGGRLDSYASRLPIALDGSNSGLQHYSAAMRSEDEGSLVSLAPSDSPSDLYQTVADDVLVSIQADADAGDELATLCLSVGVGRSLVKRNVMTFAYSSERFGFRQQLLTDTMKPLNDAVLMGLIPCNPWAIAREDGQGTDGGFKAAGYLAGKVYNSVTSIVHMATEGMGFFKSVASACAHERLPLSWVSPVGLPVLHKYSVWEVKALKLFLFDRKVPITDAGSHDKIDEDGRGVIRQVRANIRTKPLDRIDKEKARSAIAPNVIHSMDAAHLMLTVIAAKREGITNIALIHDSFGTHAGDTQRFSQIIREAFVEMYENYCPFEEVLESARASLSIEGQERLPELPTKGTMDLQAVLDASYAFA